MCVCVCCVVFYITICETDSSEYVARSSFVNPVDINYLIE